MDLSARCRVSQSDPECAYRGRSPVPVTIRVGVERGEDEREDGLDVLADEVDNVLVVPVVEGSLGNLQSP